MATMIETGITKNTIISELSRSPHGKIEEYLPVCKIAAAQQPEFFAHLLSYNRVRGQIRDAAVALPVISLSVAEFPEDFVENSLAHIATLGPRELEKAYRFALSLRLPGRMHKLRRVVHDYLRGLESIPQKWDMMAVAHSKTLASLYALSHAKRSDRIGDILFNQKNGIGAHPEGTIFDVVGKLRTMTPIEAAGAILEHKIPFLIADGAIGKMREDPDLLLALIKQMTPAQFVTNAKRLEELGVKKNPALRGAFDEAMEKASKSTRNVLKTTRAAENIDDEEIKANLSHVQEKQLSKLAGVEGDWLVLGDKSSSMSKAIEMTRQVSAILAKMVKGKVHVVFFDSVAARVFDVTGKTYEDIKSDTKHVEAEGWTSIGSGLQWALDKKLAVDGIAIITDGGENRVPTFAHTYKRYSQLIGKEVPVYMYYTEGEQHNALAVNMQLAKLDMQIFDLRHAVDFYSLPNLVQTMRTQRYGLVEEIMEYRLLTLNGVFKKQADFIAA